MSTTFLDKAQLEYEEAMRVSGFDITQAPVLEVIEADKKKGEEVNILVNAYHRFKHDPRIKKKILNILRYEYSIEGDVKNHN